MPGDIVNRWALKLEVEDVHDVRLSFQDFALPELLPSDFLVDYAQFQRMDFLVLGSGEHRCDSDKMEILDFEFFLCVFEEGVHEINTSEESLLSHFVGRKDFDHPIDHFGAQRGTDGVRRQYALLSFRGGAEMREDVVGVILADELGVCAFELLWEGISTGDGAGIGVGGVLADLVLEFEFAQ